MNDDKLTLEEFAADCGFIVKPEGLPPVREDYVMTHNFTLSNDTYLDRTPRFVVRDPVDESTAPGTLQTWTEIADDGGIEFWQQRAGSEPAWMFGFGYEGGMDWLFGAFAYAALHRYIQVHNESPPSRFDLDKWILDELERSASRIRETREGRDDDEGT